MVIAEAITFDPGVVILILVIVGGFLLACTVVAILGVVSGYRTGRCPDRLNARTVWWTCVSVETLAVVGTVTTDGPPVLVVGPGVALAAALAARAFGRSVRSPDAPLSPPPPPPSAG